jgi:nudix-type nucleoside diphosphatase (YffH/AdpP family)
MTTPRWLPADFVHPGRVALTDDVHLRPIRASDVDIDLVTVHANQPMLWQMYGAAWQWPPATLTREADEQDLARHAAEMEAHESFNYAVLDAAETTLLGCVYLDPAQGPGHAGGAEVSWWLTGDAPPELRRRLDEFVPHWVATAWPFTDVAFPVNRAPGGRGRRGVDVPDARGRTGLDRAGRDLTRNPDVHVEDVEVTSDGWHVLRRTTLLHRRSDGRWERQQRETYDRGNGATILLYDLERRTVLLTRQFRYPAYVNDHPDGMLLETAAGLLDEDEPEEAVRRELADELGVVVDSVHHVFDLYMSPGSVTERLHFFVAPWTAADVALRGGGVAAEGEDIESVELPLDEALRMVEDGRIVDGKTVLLLQWAALHLFPGR